ncbi:TetR/AcrR family transcriptional regulator C-terminal domain-containing protein [Pseudonocardia nigra]|uniref:TetR/AcrR family transcriptional regulator C-terminal domain-containing protein n=1 Tax=Pseudonocardia nigra TaxID=1921578 RepID=UPI001C5F8402|nr:TetR/AcrR family transcriptional regulator C-terminal domain-containing protein [Pseudonocardia nigra]
MTDETGLSDRVALLWGRRHGARRGPKPTLTVDDIIGAAVAVADADGLAAVSMARVAAQLGNSTMALYRHVKSKDELLLLMADAALEDPPQIPEGTDWRAALQLWAHDVLAAVRRHSWYAQIPISGPPVGPKNLAWFDRALGALADTGLDEGDKVFVVMGLLTYVQGEARLSADLAAGFAADPEAFSRQYSAALADVVDPQRMPALRRVVEAGVFDADSLFEEEDVQTDFSFGLERYLDGVAVYIAEHTRPRGT